MGLNKPMQEPKETKTRIEKKTHATKKRNLSETSADDEEPPVKAQRVEANPTSASGVRRSSRNVGKIVDYQNAVKDSPFPISFSSGVKTSENSGPLGRQTGRRRYDPSACLFSSSLFHC